MRTTLALALALAACAGCAAVLGFDDRTESHCAQTRGAHAFCLDFDEAGDVTANGLPQGHDGTVADAPGVSGRALGVALPATSGKDLSEVFGYDFDDARLLHTATICFRFQIYFEHAVQLAATDPDASPTPAAIFGPDITLLTGLQLNAPTQTIPLALAFALRSPDDPRLSPFAVGYSADAGPQLSPPGSGGGPFVQSLLSVELHDIPVGRWLDTAVAITRATGTVEVSIGGAARVQLPQPMLLDQWDGRSGVVLVGAHSYPTVGDVAVRFDDLVLDADGPCP